MIFVPFPFSVHIATNSIIEYKSKPLKSYRKVVVINEKLGLAEV